VGVPIQEESEAPLGAEPRRDVGGVGGRGMGSGEGSASEATALWRYRSFLLLLLLYPIKLRDLRSVVSCSTGAENGFSVILCPQIASVDSKFFACAMPQIDCGPFSLCGPPAIAGAAGP